MRARREEGARAGVGTGRARSGATGDAPAGAGTCPERRRGGAPRSPGPAFGGMPAGRGMRGGCCSTRGAAGSSPLRRPPRGQGGHPLETLFPARPGGCRRLGAPRRLGRCAERPRERQPSWMEATPRSKSLTPAPSPINPPCVPARPRLPERGVRARGAQGGHRHLPRPWTGSSHPRGPTARPGQATATLPAALIHGDFSFPCCTGYLSAE